MTFCPSLAFPSSFKTVFPKASAGPHGLRHHGLLCFHTVFTPYTVYPLSARQMIVGNRKPQTPGIWRASQVLEYHPLVRCCCIMMLVRCWRSLLLFISISLRWKWLCYMSFRLKLQSPSATLPEDFLDLVLRYSTCWWNFILQLNGWMSTPKLWKLNLETWLSQRLGKACVNWQP